MHRMLLRNRFLRLYLYLLLRLYLYLYLLLHREMMACCPE